MALDKLDGVGDPYEIVARVSIGTDCANRVQPSERLLTPPQAKFVNRSFRGWKPLLLPFSASPDIPSP